MYDTVFEVACNAPKNIAVNATIKDLAGTTAWTRAPAEIRVVGEGLVRVVRRVDQIDQLRAVVGARQLAAPVLAAVVTRAQAAAEVTVAAALDHVFAAAQPRGRRIAAVVFAGDRRDVDALAGVVARAALARNAAEHDERDEPTHVTRA